MSKFKFSIVSTITFSALNIFGAQDQKVWGAVDSKDDSVVMIEEFVPLSAHSELEEIGQGLEHQVARIIRQTQEQEELIQGYKEQISDMSQQAEIREQRMLAVEQSIISLQESQNKEKEELTQKHERYMYELIHDYKKCIAELQQEHEEKIHLLQQDALSQSQSILESERSSAQELLATNRDQLTQEFESRIRELKEQQTKERELLTQEHNQVVQEHKDALTQAQDAISRERVYAQELVTQTRVQLTQNHEIRINQIQQESARQLQATLASERSTAQQLVAQLRAQLTQEHERRILQIQQEALRREQQILVQEQIRIQEMRIQEQERLTQEAAERLERPCIIDPNKILLTQQERLSNAIAFRQFSKGLISLDTADHFLQQGIQELNNAEYQFIHKSMHQDFCNGVSNHKPSNYFFSNSKMVNTKGAANFVKMEKCTGGYIIANKSAYLYDCHDLFISARDCIILVNCSNITMEVSVGAAAIINSHDIRATSRLWARDSFLKLINNTKMKVRCHTDCTVLSNNGKEATEIGAF